MSEISHLWAKLVIISLVLLVCYGPLYRRIQAWLLKRRWEDRDEA